MRHGAVLIEWGLVMVVFWFPIVLAYALIRLTQLKDEIDTDADDTI